MFEGLNLTEHPIKDRIDIALIVATELEYQFALNLLSALPSEGFTLSGFCGDLNVNVGQVGHYTVCVTRTLDMGAQKFGASNDTTEIILRHFSPKAIIMPGIAFGMKKEKHSLGDILLSRAIIPYEHQRINKDGSWTDRSTPIRSSDTLYGRFKQKTHHSFSYNQTALTAQIIPGNLLSGEKLVDNIEFKQKLLMNFPEAIGGEMEGVGVASAATKAGTPWIIVKAITDWGEGKNEKHDNLSPKEAQELGCSAVFTYIKEIFEQPNVFDELNIKANNSQHAGKKIHSEDILPLLCSPIQLKHLISNKITHSIPGQRYDYYHYTNKGRNEGYTFLDFNIDIQKSLFHLSKSIEKPDIITILLKRPPIRQKNPNDRTSYISEYVRKIFSLPKDCVDVHYIDNFVRESTILSAHNKKYDLRVDYIDQDIYDFNGSKPIGQSIRHILSEIRGDKTQPVTFIYGSGGVGKTTFANTLCQTITSPQASDLQKHPILIKGQKLAQHTEIDDFQIKSISDLYKIYNDKFNEYKLSKEHFELNIACGNLLLVIDGIDEIHSRFGDNFHLTEFIRSVIHIHEKWNLAHVIITSRDFYDNEINQSITDQIQFQENNTIKKYTLRGFTENDLSLYLEKRKGKIDPSKVKRIISEMDLFNDDRVDPMLADFACLVVQLESSGYIDISKKKSDYLFNSLAIDRIVIELLHRENYAQATGFNDIDVAFYLYSEIEVDHGGEISAQILKENVEQLGGSYVNFIKSPLLKRQNSSNKTVCYTLDKYEFFPTLVQARTVHYELCRFQPHSSVETIIQFLHRSYDSNSELLLQLYKTLKIDERFTTEKLGVLHKALADQYRAAVHNRKIKIRKTVSALISILFATDSAVDKHSRTESLLRLCGSKDTVSDIHFYGNLPSIDFCSAKFKRCTFTRYNNICDSNFPLEDCLVFDNCAFEEINIEHAQNLSSSHFSKSCTFNKTNLKTIGESNLEDSKNFIYQIKDIIIKLTVFIDTGWQSENLIKGQIKLANNKISLRDFLQILCKEKFLAKHHTRGIQSAAYQIHPHFRDHITDICRDSFPPELSEIIHRIASYMK